MSRAFAFAKRALIRSSSFENPSREAMAATSDREPEVSDSLTRGRG
jgi:hypothetical protein